MLLKKCWFVLGVLAAMVAAEESSSDLKISAWGWYTFGKVGSGYKEPLKQEVDFTGAWLTDFNAGLKVEKTFENSLKFRLNVGAATYNPVTDLQKENREFLQRKFVFYIIDAAIERAISLNEKSSLLAEFGYLPVRYNPQAYNLGEYLFGRTTPYPAVVESGFELADKEKAPGFHAGYTMKFLNKSVLKLDDYLFTELKMWPIGDVSNVFLASVNMEQLVEIGWGINSHHFLSVDKRQTTPGLDSVRVSGNFALHAYEKVNADGTIDTTLYTARGTKMMARITLNPRALIASDILGSEDLKLYAEAAILGIKNYDGWYENRKERIPLMFGFNFPTFKLLDVLSFQMQWFGSKYYNTWENQNKEGKLTPYVKNNSPGTTYDDWLDTLNGFKPVTVDDWKWSIYMSRKINNRVRLSLQFANDNTFKTKYIPGPPYAFTNYTEIGKRTWAVKDGKEQFFQIWDWYWMGRIMFYL